MFQLRALDSDIDQLRLCSVELGLGLRHVTIGGDTAGIAVAGEREELLVGLDGCLEQGDIAIDAVQLEVVLGKLRLIAAGGHSQEGRGGLGGIRAGGDAAADAAPEIDGVGGVHGKVVVRRADWWVRSGWRARRALRAVTEGCGATRGKSAERATRTAALASRNCASACSTFWLEMLTCSSRALSAGSLKISHHLPRSTPSLGCASFQPAGGASLNCGRHGSGRALIGGHLECRHPERKATAESDGENCRALLGRMAAMVYPFGSYGLRAPRARVRCSTPRRRSHQCCRRSKYR